MKKLIVKRIGFDWASPPSRAVVMFTKYADIQNVELQQIRLTKNEHKTNEYKRLFPMQVVPSLLELDLNDPNYEFAITESAAIMRYLADTNSSKIPDGLYPKSDQNPQLRAKIDMMVDWNHVGLRYQSNRLIFLKYFVKLRKLDIVVSQSEVDETEKRMLNGLTILEMRLNEGHQYLIDDQISMADFSSLADVTQLRFLINCDQYLDQFPKVKQWQQKMFELQAVKESHDVFFDLVQKSQEKYKDLLV
ncbi:glutathione s-c-terminal domain containing protein [Stylonychia lemnae]|uniref:Glutathione s-c-terminal domain containing protein n=1 Tax=Stylonychia lemnae TaxID=5949 RepID=A0A078B757_STYLE|nr:glutathione s-c-terminal domain containing protein [Stylonychia lemnae]|eukprot:CDW90239.1 glutathione s-c-terminal domain containing protein [Stylonychia lemnae]